MDAAYNAWANRLLIDVLQGIERPPLVDGILAHLAAATETWLARLGGDDVPSPVLWPTLLFEESVARIAAADARLQESRDSAARVVYRNLAGTTFDNSVAEIMTQVLNHATYHRGEIAGLLLAAGLEPPITDYIAYLRSR